MCAAFAHMASDRKEKPRREAGAEGEPNEQRLSLSPSKAVVKSAERPTPARVTPAAWIAVAADESEIVGAVLTSDCYSPRFDEVQAAIDDGRGIQPILLRKNLAGGAKLLLENRTRAARQPIQCLVNCESQGS
jgi:hypothetical protein